MTPSHFVRLISVADLPPGGGLPAQVGGRQIAVFNVDGTFYAVENECPHRGGSLVDGALLGTSVVCPLHRWQFSLLDGANVAGAGMGVSRYPVEVRNGGVWVDLRGTDVSTSSDDAV